MAGDGLLHPELVLVTVRDADHETDQRLLMHDATVTNVVRNKAGVATKVTIEAERQSWSSNRLLDANQTLRVRERLEALVVEIGGFADLDPHDALVAIAGVLNGIADEAGEIDG